MMTVKFKILILIPLCLGAIPLIFNSASAHRVNVFAWVDGDTIRVESKFSGGKKIKAGKVLVTDSHGAELLAGSTSNQGEYSFKVPKQSDLRIIVMAGQGHQGEWTIREAELQGTVSEKTPQAGLSKNNFPGQTNVGVHKSDDLATEVAGRRIDPEELKSLIESVLDRKLQPVTKMLADMQQKGPGIKDIFAGIGYILGLVGIAAYIQNRKKKE